ncbi:hypothetical protein QBC46DRAFT_440130, partial [Diplogelasinospora grovesii]
GHPRLLRVPQFPESPTPIINPKPTLQSYFQSFESRIGYRLVLGGTRYVLRLLRGRHSLALLHSHRPLPARHGREALPRAPPTSHHHMLAHTII